MQHYAFLVDDDLFDRAYARLREWGITHWADPQMTRPGKPTPNTAGAASHLRPPRGTESN